MIGSWPRAILHVDGDCFFASCEIALRPELRGKPVVTGLERGIASSMSYEAKAMGVKRGMRLGDIKKVCPKAIILPSDYETYSLFSYKLFNIVRRYTSVIEEYGIEECFADLTGLRRPLHMSYEQMAEKIKSELATELGLSFSVGLAPTKVLAKIASKFNKPNGLVIIPGKKIHLFLEKFPVGNIWGIGPQTTAYLEKFGIKNSLQLALRDEEWVKKHLSKPFYEIWQELRGQNIYALNTERKTDYQSIQKTKTFTPPSTDKNYVFSQLSKNVENACIKARRHKLAAQVVYFFIKTQEFGFRGYEFKLTNPLNTPAALVKLVRQYFDKVWKDGFQYRSTGIILNKLTEEQTGQLDLFGQVAKLQATLQIYRGVDDLSRRYGKHVVFLGSSYQAINNIVYNTRAVESRRKVELFRGETRRRRLSLPLLGKVV